MTGCRITIGDNSVLEGADIQESSEGYAATRIRDGLQADFKFINDNKGWSSIDFSVKRDGD